MIFDLSAEVDQLNCAEDAFMYRLILDGLVLFYSMGGADCVEH